MQMSDFSETLIFLVALPLIGAGIGWLTNRLAIQMLFRPRQPVRFAGITLQGLIPRRHHELAQRIGELVEKELFQQHLIRTEIRKIDIQPHVEELAASIVWNRLGPRLRQVPLLGGLVNDKLLASLHAMALESLREETDPLLDKVAIAAERHIKIRHLVEERVRGLDLAQLETLVRQLAKKEFQGIEVLGGLIGFVLGLLQALLVLLA
ncbi:MAG: hypothetical protein RL648_744 [Verrucomicrobiota bacterium]|jgi:uncharacterized membrane protein YheB (UPF0754 family)